MIGRRARLARRGRAMARHRLGQPRAVMLTPIRAEPKRAAFALSQAQPVPISTCGTVTGPPARGSAQIEARGDFRGAGGHAAPSCACSAALAASASAMHLNRRMTGRHGWPVAKPARASPEASCAPGSKMRRGASDGDTSGALWVRARRLRAALAVEQAARLEAGPAERGLWAGGRRAQRFDAGRLGRNLHGAAGAPGDADRRPCAGGRAIAWRRHHGAATGHPASRLHELPPWNWKRNQAKDATAARRSARRYQQRWPGKFGQPDR